MFSDLLKKGDKHRRFIESTVVAKRILVDVVLKPLLARMFVNASYAVFKK